jgi:ABC-type transporter Mla MlaB component
MNWVGGDHLFSALAEAAPTGVRDADPSFWLARLDALRLANRVDQFDETAIDYCVTYEVSPPSWEPTRCKVRLSGSGLTSRPSAQSLVTEVSTSFQESTPYGAEAVATVELSGQLAGDIAATLERMRSNLRDASLVKVSCARLMRVDFIAAGDLLNWVLSRRQENRAIQFTDAHRLVALFFGAMGITEHAKVMVRQT